MAEKKKSTAYAVPVTAASDKKKALETAIAQIEKNYGKGAIMRLGDDIPVNVEAISTGSLSLDLALGIGGVPRGRIVEIYGPESCGKTTLGRTILGLLPQDKEVTTEDGFAGTLHLVLDTIKTEPAGYSSSTQPKTV